MSTVKKIPVNSAKISGSHSNMPLYINPSVMSGWGSVTLPEAQSMRFYSDAGLTTELAREVVSQNEIHVKVPSVTTTTEIWCSYDGIASDYGVATSFGRNAVWSGVDFVNHFHNGDFGDSSGNGKTATNNGTSAIASSKIGNDSREFVRSESDYMTIASVNWKTNKAVSIWVNVGGYQTNNGRMILDLRANASSRYAVGSYQIVDNDFEFGFNDGSWRRTNEATKPTNEWVLYHFVMRSGSIELFRNGVSRNSNSVTPVDTTATLNISRRSASSDHFVDMYLDELRTYNTDPSADWITTEYNNQDDVASFWGTVTDVGGAPVTNNGFMAWL